MKRGVIQLNQASVSVIDTFLQSSSDDTLKRKFNAAKEDAIHRVQLSIEEVEYILDRMPHPSESDPATNEARLQLTAFGHQLHELKV